MTTRTEHPAAAATRIPEAPPGIDEVRLSPATSPDVFPEVAAALRQPTRSAGVDGTGPAPTGHPGQLAAGVGENLGKITHLWSYESPLGVWVFIDGIGWKRLSPASEHGHNQMAVLASIATHADTSVYYNLDSSGYIDRIYV